MANVNSIGVVFRVGFQADGTLPAGGFFTTLGATTAATTRNRLARVSAYGLVDTTFADPNINGSVYAMAFQPGGQILAGGDFSKAGSGSATYNDLARFNTDGTIDTSLSNPAFNAPVRALALQSDGQILAGGQFTSVGGTARSYATRLNPNGSVDTSFANPGFSAAVTCIAVQPDKKILTGGQFTSVGGSAYAYLVRLNADGTVDTSFPNSAVHGVGNAVALPANGKILIRGAFTSVR